MNKIKRFMQNSIVRTTGKILMLCGIALTVTACYAPYNPERHYNGPDFYEDETSQQKNDTTTQDDRKIEAEVMADPNLK